MHLTLPLGVISVPPEFVIFTKVFSASARSEIGGLPLPLYHEFTPEVIVILWACVNSYLDGKNSVHLSFIVL